MLDGMLELRPTLPNLDPLSWLPAGCCPPRCQPRSCRCVRVLWARLVWRPW